MRYLGFFARSGSTRRPRRVGRPTHRLARLEPLEQRTLLSVTPGFENLNTAPDGPGSFPAAHVANEPAGQAINTIRPADGSANLSAGAEVPAQEDTGGQATSAAETQAWLYESVRVSVWTPELIADLPARIGPNG